MSAQHTPETPQTDAEYWKQYPNGTDGWECARRFERINAELRAALEEIAEFYSAFVANAGRGESFSVWSSKARKLTDQSRAAIAKARAQ